ncbi:translation initiation factor eIF-2B [bacterium]|nr:translation initiation factor eIF-2B [bacterium]
MIKHFQQIASDNTSGATELIHKLLALCENCAIGYHLDDLGEGFALLEHSQKSMPSLHAVLQILKSDFLPKLRDGEENVDAISYLLSLEKILTESGDTIAELFTEKFTETRSIVTISRSSTVMSAFYHLHEVHRLRKAVVLEARPMMEGHRTIRDLQQRGVQATLMVDAAMCQAMEMVDCAVVGADSISADGYLLNKTGTFPLAICCKEMGIPLYVLCDSLKFSPQLKDRIVVEDRPAEEIITREEGDNFEVWNQYFEWTPVDYVTEFITERGILTPDQLSALVGEDNG